MTGNNCMCVAPAWRCGCGKTCRVAITLRRMIVQWTSPGLSPKALGLWLIDGQEVITSAGDSYYLPAGTMYGLTVLEELSAVEVLSPPLQDG